MGTAIIKLKIMPDSPDVNLQEIERKAEKIIKPNTIQPIRFEKEPIAFGLIALICQFAIDESKEIDPIENQIKKIEHVSSTEIIDFRRAFG